MKKSHEPHSDEEVGDKNTGSENHAIKENLSPLLPNKSEIGDKKDDRRKGAGIDTINEASDQHGRKAPPPESLDDVLLSLLQSLLCDLFPWWGCPLTLVLCDQLLETLLMKIICPEIILTHIEFMIHQPF